MKRLKIVANSYLPDGINLDIHEQSLIIENARTILLEIGDCSYVIDENGYIKDQILNVNTNQESKYGLNFREVFTEEEVTEVSEKILSKTIDKIKDEIGNKFYSEMNSFLLEHYDNVSSDIHKKLIKEISDEFIKDPENYKFLSLRRKMFDENKDTLTSILTDEFIKDRMEDVFWQRFNNDNIFKFKWVDGIVKLITENYNEIIKDDNINCKLLNEIKNLKEKNIYLQNRINELDFIL